MTLLPTNSPLRQFMAYATILVTLLFIVIGIWPKSVSFVAANFYHTPQLDTFFTWYTAVGDGVTAIVLVAIFFLIRNRNLAVKLFLSFLLSGIVAQVLKYLFQAPRPKVFFAGQAYAHFIDGVTKVGNASFPSGHTTTAFAIAATLSFNTNRKFVPMLCFWMAVLVGYSRVYLGQHFVEDVLAGMVTGILSALIIEQVVMVYSNRKKAGKSLAPATHEHLAIEL